MPMRLPIIGIFDRTSGGSDDSTSGSRRSDSRTKGSNTTRKAHGQLRGRMSSDTMMTRASGKQGFDVSVKPMDCEDGIHYR